MSERIPLSKGLGDLMSDAVRERFHETRPDEAKVIALITEFSERFPDIPTKDHESVVRGTLENYFSEEGLRQWYDENAERRQEDPNFVRRCLDEPWYFYTLTHSDI